MWYNINTKYGREGVENMNCYEKNVSEVMNTLAKYQYDSRGLHLVQRCYDELKRYMEEGGIITFSQEAAIEWCKLKAGKTYQNQFVNVAIQRLADVYTHGQILKEHIRFLGPLSEAWSQDLSEYLGVLALATHYSDNYQRSIKDICIQFCRFAQMDGINSVQGIDFPLLERYHQYIQSRHASYPAIEGVISKFLSYLAEKNKYQGVYSLFIHYIGVGKCTSLDKLSVKSGEAIECRRKAEICFSSDKFYSSIPEFVAKLGSFGYSRRVQKSSNYYLTVLYLFLVRGDLGYDKVIADTWLREFGNNLFGNETRKARRIIEMYEDYHATGDVIPEHWWKHSITAYDILPKWCKVEIDCFLAAKAKEGCSKGTVVSIKTHVVSFCQFLVSQGIAAFAGVTPEVIKKFNVQDQHKTPAGKNLYNRHIRRFLIYLELKQVIPAGLHFALLHCATGGGKIVEVLSQGDRARIRTYCEKASTPLELRDAAILKIGMTTALRSSDIVALKISDIDWKNRMIRIVQSKTKVEHLHPIETGTGNAIFKYLQNGRCRKADNSYLFIAIRAPYGPLSQEACSKSMERAGTTSTDFHRLRRTYATDMLNAGATFIETAELLGHTDTQNIHKYATLDQERMRLCPLSMAETGLALEGRYGYE